MRGSKLDPMWFLVLVFLLIFLFGTNIFNVEGF